MSPVRGAGNCASNPHSPAATHNRNRPTPPSPTRTPRRPTPYGFVVSDSSAARVAGPYTPGSSVRMPRVNWYVRTALSVLLS